MNDSFSTYQVYDFIKDVNFHIDKKIPILLINKSQSFKDYLFKLKSFNLLNKIRKSDPIFEEDYFIFIRNNMAYVSKKIGNDPPRFDYVEIVDGLKIIRNIKLKKLFK